jgi:hypothetical protein
MKKSCSPHLKLLLLNVAFLFVFTGCATKQVKLTETGFLSSYSDLEENEDFQGMYIYKNPGVNIAQKYSAILISPVQFKLDPAVKENSIEEEDREKLAQYYHERLEENLEKNYTVTDAPGNDVLLLRTAVTGVLPNKVYLNLHWSTTLIGAGIGGASLEAELVDSLTGERMLSFVDARKGRKLNYTKGLTKWGHTKEVLGIWADMIVENLDGLKEKYEAGI